jgi:hypothetical protein
MQLTATLASLPDPFFPVELSLLFKVFFILSLIAIG